MSNHPDPPDGPFSRPYLDDPAAPAARWVDPGHEGAGEPADIRPYLMTGGRTGTGRVAVALETVVVVSDLVRTGRPPTQNFERARILALCTVPRSVAEVAAQLSLPLGVASTLVADLITDGLLDAADIGRRQAYDVELLERLIAGVSAL